MAVDTDSMLIVGAFVAQACNDKQQIAPILDMLKGQKDQIGLPTPLLGDTGFFSVANVNACLAAGIEPLMAMKRDEHHPPPMERWTEPPTLADGTDAVTRMAHKLRTISGRADYSSRKQTVEPVFSIIKHVMKFRHFLMRGGRP